MGLGAFKVVAIASFEHKSFKTDHQFQTPFVGQVCVQGQECKGMEVAVAAGGGGAKTPDDIIAKHCNACHGTGLLGAPKIGDTAAVGTYRVQGVIDQKGGHFNRLAGFCSLRTTV